MSEQNRPDWEGRGITPPSGSSGQGEDSEVNETNEVNEVNEGQRDYRQGGQGQEGSPQPSAQPSPTPAPQPAASPTANPTASNGTSVDTGSPSTQLMEYPTYESIPDDPYLDTSPGFRADRRLGRLKFDLRPFVDAYGVMPEPNEHLLNQWHDREYELIKEANGMEGIQTVYTDEDGTEKFNLEAYAKIMEFDRSARNRGRENVALVCNGTPNQKQIYALPPLVFMDFYNWLRGELGEG